MELSKPEIFKARLAEKFFLNEGRSFLFLRFELIRPARIKFRAGQYISVKVSDAGERRSYSLANTPDVDHAVELVVDITPGGVGSRFFQKIRLGEEIEFLGPLGRFVVAYDASEVEQDELKGRRKFLFVGTGSGIVPLRSMVLDLLRNRRETRPIRLHWGLRREEDVFWLDDFRQLMEEFPNFVFDLVLSQPKKGWQLCWGHVQDCLLRDLIPNEDMSEWEAYLCGNPKMIEEVKQLLIGAGMPEEKIFWERFG